METNCFEKIADAEVVARLVELLREERRLTAAVLVHLGEVEARRLYQPAACPSMHVYCVRVLGMSADQAYKRIRAARAVRRHPVIGTAVAEGRLHLGGVLLLAPHVTADNAEELVAEASGKSKAEIEVLLARRAPKPDIAQRLDRVAQQIELVAPAGPALAPGPAREAKTARLAPLSADRFALQVTIGEATRSKLLRAQALLRHKVPSGDFSELIDQALDALLDKVEKRKFGKTGAPRKAKAGRVKRYVSNEARREAVTRDGMQCSFVSEDGRRCEETGFLELDHVVPVAIGGDGSDGVRILCRSHNQYEAERILGRETVDAGKAARALDDDLVAGLRRLGVTTSDARQAVAASRGPASVEERLRAALGALRNIYSGRGTGTRCREPVRAFAHTSGGSACPRERAMMDPCGGLGLRQSFWWQSRRSQDSPGRARLDGRTGSPQRSPSGTPRAGPPLLRRFASQRPRPRRRRPTPRSTSSTAARGRRVTPSCAFRSSARRTGPPPPPSASATCSFARR